MVFNSFTFAVFFTWFYLLYLVCGRRLRLQNLLLLAGSYLFYGWWDWRFLGLILISTLVDYACGRMLDRREAVGGQAGYAHGRRVRRIFLAVSVVTNLGILGVFKYFDFFATGLADVLDTIGLGIEPRLLDVILPVGISFYTFQTLSYTIDVYRGAIRGHRSLLEFAVFVAFFPQLVAGPILRAKDFLPQVARCRTIALPAVYEGGYLILWGLFKKVVIADNLALMVDKVFNLPDEGHYGGRVLVALYAFAVQIYCDFSGYTDMARGCAKMMGFDIPVNFRLPYLAANPSEFWRRWHITLSTWFRDYVYIPLGGNRRGVRRTCLNLMITMMLCGLWHGAAWTFVAWGVFHGALLIGHHLWRSTADRLQNRLTTSCGTGGFGGEFSRIVSPVERGTCVLAGLRRVAAVIVMFHLVCLGWLIFRADSLAQVTAMADALFRPWPYWILAGANSIHATRVMSLLAWVWPLVVMHMIQARSGDLQALLRWPAPARGLAYAVMICGLAWFGTVYGKPFIYFKF